MQDARAQTTIACMAVGTQSAGGGTDRRVGPRVAVEFPCNLSRRNGSVVSGRTLDVGAGGMRIATERPLGIDEVLDFELAADGTGPVSGRARVMREHTWRVYAIRFERLGDAARQQLTTLTAEQPLH